MNREVCKKHEDNCNNNQQQSQTNKHHSSIDGGSDVTERSKDLIVLWRNLKPIESSHIPVDRIGGTTQIAAPTTTIASTAAATTTTAALDIQSSVQASQYQPHTNLSSVPLTDSVNLDGLQYSLVQRPLSPLPPPTKSNKGHSVVHLELVSCPRIFSFQLRSEKSFETHVPPVQVSELLYKHATIKCPSRDCELHVNICAMSLHLAMNHRRLATMRAKPGRSVTMYLEFNRPADVVYNRRRCHAIVHFEGAVIGLGSDWFSKVLPVVIMSMHVKMSEVSDVEDDDDPNEMVTLLWASTFTSRHLPLTVTLSAFSVVANAEHCQTLYTGKLYNLNHTFRATKLFRSGRMLLLTAYQLYTMTMNGCRNLGLDVMIETRK